MSRKTHWIIRIGDGENLRNSTKPIFGVNRGRSTKKSVSNIQPGDILWFATNKGYGGKLIGMAEYDTFVDKKDEPLVQIYSVTNEEQNWKGNEEWDIQIHYKNFYDTEKQNIRAVIQHAGSVLKYDTIKTCNGRVQIPDDLYKHYENFKFYAEPKQF